MTNVESPFEKVYSKMIAARSEFVKQLATFKQDELVQKVDNDEWSPLQLAYHIYLTDELAQVQMEQVQNEDNPLLDDILESAPRLTREAELPVSLESILAGMATRREKLFAYLSSLSPETWERPLRQPVFGPLKFYQFVDVLPHHEQQHAQQLASLKLRLQEQK
jgi:hypothetical protein